MHYSTVARHAHRGRFPLKYKTVVKKPALTQRQRQIRLSFAKSNLRRNWKSVMFTDSKYWYYQGGEGSQRSRAWVEGGSKPASAQYKHPQKVHAYGGISHKGTLGLFLVSGTTSLKSRYAPDGCCSKGVQGTEYGNLLKEEFIPGCKRLLGGTHKWTFMQDNAPPHKTSLNMALLHN